MSKQSCSYHEARPAVWGCDECARRYCAHCVVITDRDPAGAPRCALCSGFLKYLGGGNAAAPFWSVAHRFFAYPLGGSGIAFMAMMAFLSLLVPIGLLGLFVLLFALAAGVKYCFAVLESVAMGGTRPPSVSDAVSGDEAHLFLRFIGLLLAVGLLQALIQWFIHPALGVVAGLLVTLVMPAMIILLAVNKKVSDALSPGRLARLITGIGWPYVLAVFLTNLVSTGPYLVLVYFGEGLANSILVLPVLAVLMSYFAVVSFAMLGYLIYEHQGSLGYVAGDPDDARVPGSPENRRNQLLGEVNVLVKEDRQAEALDRLHQRRAELAEDLTFHQRHFDLALQGPDGNIIARAAEPYLELLMTREAVDRALEVWRQAARIHPAYRPANAAICHTLAEHAHAANLGREALALLVNLHKRDPDYAELADAYQLAARILREAGNDGKADELERFVPAFLARRAQDASGNLTLSSLR